MTKDYLVILDRRPKVQGHTLLISTQQLDDITQLDPDSAHAKRLFRGIVETGKLLKERLTGKDGKVYVMTMCEHWKASELKSSRLPNTSTFISFPGIVVCERRGR